MHREDDMCLESMGFHIGYAVVSTFEALSRQDLWQEQLSSRFWRLLASVVSPHV